MFEMCRNVRITLYTDHLHVWFIPISAVKSDLQLYTKKQNKGIKKNIEKTMT